jgi:phenylpropionate dioxygenase-like ring-hydroxylating dioxygenase large terminal subunit
MSRQQLIDITRREIDNMQNDRIDLMPDVLKVPTADYYDQERWELEVERIFKRVPLALAFSCEFTSEGDFRTLEVAGVPVLIARASDGKIGAFVNMCSHRGNMVVEESAGNAKSFRCGYHAWNYGLNGDLINVFDESNFGPIDKACNGLTRLPAAERAGIVWVTLQPDAALDIDLFLSGYGEMLEHLAFDETHVAGRQDLQGPNWKVAYDGYRDFYHVPILHRKTFGTELSHQPDYYAWGPHVRMTAPANYAEQANTSEADWTDADLTQGVWTIFPNVSIAGGRPGRGGGQGSYMFSQMFPGSHPGESVTTQNFLAFGSPDEVDAQGIEDYMSFMLDVVRDEDYYTGLRVQKALRTGAKEYSYFGRNEGGGQLFHRWVDTLIKTEDRDLPGLFENLPAELQLPGID